MSSQFTACNGVKQGAILSPILFSIYMDGLFEQLEKSGVGCHMGNHYRGCIGYADDLISDDHKIWTQGFNGYYAKNMHTTTV